MPGWIQEYALDHMLKHGDHDQSTHGNRHPGGFGGEHMSEHGSVQSYVQASMAEGGFTIESFEGDEPNKGWMVAIPGHERVLEPDEVTETVLAEYLTENRDALLTPNAHWGGWFDRQTGQVYLDVSILVDTETEATDLGREWNQKAVFNLETHEEKRLDKAAPRLVGTFLPLDAKAAKAKLDKLIAKAKG